MEVVVSVLVVLHSDISKHNLALPCSTHLSNEQSQESVNIFSSGGRVVDLFIVRVRVSDTNRLIHENDVCLVGPTVRVVGNIDLVVFALGDLTWSKLKEQAGGRAASGTTVQPKNERIFRGLGSGFKEPEEQVLGFGDVEETRDLLDVWVADRWVLGPMRIRGDSQSVLGVGRMGESIVCSQRTLGKYR